MNPYGVVVVAVGIILVYLGISGHYRHALSTVTGR